MISASLKSIETAEKETIIIIIIRATQTDLDSSAEVTVTLTSGILLFRTTIVHRIYNQVADVGSQTCYGSGKVEKPRL